MVGVVVVVQVVGISSCSSSSSNSSRSSSSISNSNMETLKFHTCISFSSYVPLFYLSLSLFAINICIIYVKVAQAWVYRGQHMDVHMGA